MKTFVPFLAALAAVGANAMDYVCETSDDSPYLHHVDTLITNLKNEGASSILCLDYSLGSDTCGPTQTDWSGEGGGAAFQACQGPDGNDGDSQPLRCAQAPNGMPCITGCGGMTMGQVGGEFEALRDQCQGPDSNGDTRVGGKVMMEEGASIRLYSMPG